MMRRYYVYLQLCWSCLKWHWEIRDSSYGRMTNEIGINRRLRQGDGLSAKIFDLEETIMACDVRWTMSYKSVQLEVWAADIVVLARGMRSLKGILETLSRTETQRRGLENKVYESWMCWDFRGEERHWVKQI